ncbi:hypothetical protein P9139_10220 [Curtobacterium flaccumfaciens]|nr:hypothetical protein P9139_10220 [Curtobacterium flaccumfaciens]
MRRRMIAALAAAATVALATAGCSASGNADQSSGSGGSLVYATGEPDHLTPGRQTVAFDQVQSLFAPLTQTDAKGKLHDVAAKSVESSDNVTWTITLRDGWKFQNGETVTPEKLRQGLEPDRVRPERVGEQRPARVDRRVLGPQPGEGHPEDEGDVGSEGHR